VKTTKIILKGTTAAKLKAIVDSKAAKLSKLKESPLKDLTTLTEVG